MKKYFIISGVILLILFISFYYLDTVNSPKVGLSQDQKEQQLEKILGQKPVLSITATPTGNMVYNGKGFILSYPAAAQIYTYQDPNEKKDSQNLDSFQFEMTDSHTMFSALAVSSGNLKILQDVPGVQLRLSRAGSYKASQISAGGVSGLLFTESDTNAEKTAFFLQNNIIYSFSATGTDFDAVSEVFDAVIKSVKFE